MKHGRPPRADESPDSVFGVLLKDYLRHANMTQKALARLIIVQPEVITRMVKGDRESGKTLRRDLRAIIEVLYQRKVLHTLDEANTLVTTIPTFGKLDGRDDEDAKIIQLLQSSQEQSEESIGEAKLIEEHHEHYDTQKKEAIPTTAGVLIQAPKHSRSFPDRRVLLSLAGLGAAMLVGIGIGTLVPKFQEKLLLHQMIHKL